MLILWLLEAAMLTAQTTPNDAERVAANKKTILERMRREKPTYRGDKPGEMRLRWEWYNRTVNSYLFEKAALLTRETITSGSRFNLRAGWVYQDMKVTFAELLGMDDGEGDKLVPILAHRDLLDDIPNATLKGLTLRGKQGEVKGTITTKYKFRNLYGVMTSNLEYKTPQGKTQRAFGVSLDAFTIRLGDIATRVADETSQAKELEDLELIRDALYPEEDEKEQEKTKK